jgi:membrane protein DedA with SNARE-associated domain
MRDRLKTYTAYSIASAIVWIVLIAIGVATGKTSTQHTVLFVILGWAIGWTSATIARYIYPPPKKYRNPAN